MTREECRERIMSNDYADFIIRESQTAEASITDCVINSDILYSFIFVERSRIEPVGINRMTYSAIPKCYGLNSAQALEASGIFYVQNQNNLKLTGENVIIGVIDTGID